MGSDDTRSGGTKALPSPHPSRSRRAFGLAVVVLVLAAAGLRFWALDFGLPHHMTRPDEEAVIARTALPARGTFDLQWLIYPSGYVYLCWAWGTVGLKAGQLLGVMPPGDYLSVLRKRPDRIILVNRVLSALAGTATVALLVMLARAELGSGVALGAGALLATNFLHVRESHAVKPDILLALAMVCALGAMLRLAHRAVAGRAAIVGVAIGLAMAMKYPAVLLLGSAYVAAWMGSGRRGWRRLLSGPWVIACVVAGVTFIGTSPYLVLNPATFARLVSFVSRLFPHAAPVALQPAPTVPGFPDTAAQAWWEGWVYHAVFSLRYGVGVLPTLLAPIAVIWGLVQRRPLPVLAATTVLLFYAVIGAAPAVQSRYMTPLVPLLALLEAGVVFAVAGRVLDRRRAAWAVVLVTAVLIAEPLMRAVAHDRVAARTDTRVLATRWMEENLPRGATLVVLGTQVWPWGMPRIPPGVRHVYVRPDPAALAEAGVSHVLTHDHVLFSSRVDPATMEMLAPHLRLLAEFDPFTPGRNDAIFESRDAFYIPIDHFGAVTRPGPRVRIYAFESAPER